MTAPAVVGEYVPEPWNDLPLTDTPITARRLARFENQLAQLTAGMAAVLKAGATGKLLLATGSPEQARGVIGAAAQVDLNSRVVNIGGISGLLWVDTTPTAASLVAAGIPSGTLVLFPGGLGVLQGNRFIPVGLTSGSSLAASAAPTGIGTLTVTASVAASTARVAQPAGQGFLTVTGVASSSNSTLVTPSGSGALTVTVSVAAYGGTYNDTYGDTYGSNGSGTGFGASGFGSSGFGV